MAENINAAAIIDATLTLSPSARDTFLNSLDPSVSNGAELSQAIASISNCLAALRTAGGLEAHAALEAQPDTPFVPGKIEHYELGDILGSGGFAEVYAARQLKPVERDVALKVLRSGRDGDMITERFMAEQQALAQLEHPSIAAVFDAGETETGRPFFAMEKVQGTSITDYSRQGEVSLRERLRLFVDVCEAVEYAHTRGIVHRDLKPSNVMVSDTLDTPRVKVIDFGIAKAIDRSSSAGDPITIDGQMLGTPTSMSPEQLGVIDTPVDRRADVFALGMLLYELLTDTTPFDDPTTEATLISAWRYAREEISLPQASRRVATSGTHTRSFARALSGDLDWIITKAIQQNPIDRYQSVADLRRDIIRYVKHQPVTAGPPSFIYRSKKFLRRNWLALSTTLVVVLSLAGALAQTTLERRLTEKAVHDLTRVTAFQSQMLSDLDPYFLGRDLQAGFEQQLKIAAPLQSSLIDQTLQRINYTDLGRQFIESTILTRAVNALSALSDQPNVVSQLQQSLGRVYLGMGLRKRAVEQFESALSLYDVHEGADHRQKLTLLRDLAEAYDQNGDYDKALAIATSRIQYANTHFTKDQAEFLEAASDLASVHISFGNYAEAERLQAEANLGFLSLYGPKSEKALGEQHEYATIIHHQGRLQESLTQREQILAVRERILDPLHQDLILSYIGMGSILHHLGQLSRAEEFMQEAYSRRRQSLGEDHPRTLSLYNRLGALAFDQGRLAEAEQILREALQRYDRAPELDQPRRLLVMESLGRTLGAMGKTEESIEVLEKAHKTSVAFQGANNPETLGALYSLAMMNAEAGKQKQATEQYLIVQKGYLEILGADHPRYAALLISMAALDVEKQELTRAHELFEQARAILDARFPGSNHPFRARFYAERARLFELLGRQQAAREDLVAGRDMYNQLGRHEVAADLDTRLRQLSNN